MDKNNTQNAFLKIKVRPGDTVMLKADGDIVEGTFINTDHSSVTIRIPTDDPSDSGGVDITKKLSAIEPDSIKIISSPNGESLLD